MHLSNLQSLHQGAAAAARQIPLGKGSGMVSPWPHFTYYHLYFDSSRKEIMNE